MASKRTKAAPAKDEIDDLFEGIGDDGAKKGAKPKVVPAKKKSDQPEKDILADLESELGEKAPSRPHTPRVKEGAVVKGSPVAKRPSTDTPPVSSNVPRKSGESTRSFHASFTPSATSSELADARGQPVEQTNPAVPEGNGSGWWGGIFATASAVKKQAEQAYKDIQQNEDAKKWADQVRGNVGALRGIGGELRSRAIPTFTNILHTLAPPISSHERLLIHTTHDLVGYPSLDPLIHGVFSRVMAQVEGGDLVVIQRGNEAGVRRGSDPAGAFFTSSSSSAGWRDGPWWRATDSPRDLGLVKGLTEGTKLCRANAEGYAAEYFAVSGGLAAARQRAVEPVSESNPVRSSDLFLAVQALQMEGDRALFAGGAKGEKQASASEGGPSSEGAAEKEDEQGDETVCFAVFVLDPVHEIQYAAVSQAMPAKWVRWLDAASSSPSPLTPASGEEGGPEEREMLAVPEEIRDIIESGGVDPREWVAEWVEEVLTLAVGVVAQRYVARRMGVGEGGLGRGKQRAETVTQEGGGEAARAGVI